MSAENSLIHAPALPAPAGPDPMARLSHHAGLDGLRGVALLGVLLFHSEGWLSGGFLGVDLFFVLSGFLITRLLLHEQAQTGSIAWLAFWGRRFRRLAPALLSLFPALAVYARYFMDAEARAGFRSDAFATLLYVANWRSIFTDRDYWQLFAAPSPLEHSWSLSIEEQFYLLWPLVVVGSLWFARRAGLRSASLKQPVASQVDLARVVFWVSVSLALLSAVLVPALYNPNRVFRAYLGTDTRAAAVLLGAALAAKETQAVALLAKKRLFSGGITGLVLCFTGVSWWRAEGQDYLLYHGGLLLHQFGSLLLIAQLVGPANSWLVRVFSLSPLRYLGKVSYGAYLWHWPLFCLLTPERLAWAWPAVHVLRFALTLSVAHVSLHFIETPIRRGKLQPGAVWLAGAALTAMAVSYVVTMPRFDDAKPLATKLLAQGARVIGARPGVFSVPFQDFPPVGSLPAGTTRVLVLGDSVANKLGTAMRYRQEEFDSFVAERGVGNCSILRSATGLGSADGPRDCAASWLTDVEQLRPEVTFLVLGGGFLNRMPVNDDWASSCSAEFKAAYTARLTELVGLIRPLAGRLFVARVPYPVGRWRGRDTLATVDCFNQILENTLRPFGVEWVDLMQHVCPTPECRLLDGGAAIRPDGLHFDGTGTENTARFSLQRVVGKVPTP